jgi:hypothetical protein
MLCVRGAGAWVGGSGAAAKPSPWMAIWKYAPVPQEDGTTLPETVQQTGGGGSHLSEDDIALKKRMPFCIGL